jgi:hypothetical protein
MKTFKEFIEESYLILERSKPKFRGTRTPEEIEALRQKRREQQPQHQEPSSTSQKIINKHREKAIHHFKLSKTPEGKVDTNSPHHEKSREHNSRALGRELPDYQVLDTKKYKGSTKGVLRKISQATRAIEKGKGLNPDTVKPSEHPDTHSSKASEFDKIVHKRRRIRNKAQRNKEAVDTQGREFRRGEIQKTIGKIPGQLKR